MDADHRHDDLDKLLEHLDRRIQALEAELEKEEKGDPGPRYFESGSIHPELDDQAIAP